MTHALQRGINTVRCLGSGVLRIARGIFTFSFGFGTGIALSAVLGLLAGAAALITSATRTIDETKAYRPLIPLIGNAPDKSCGTRSDAIPTISHPVQKGEGHQRLHEPFKTADKSTYDCAIQNHVNQSVNYDLAFLEFNNAGALIAPGQWRALKKHLEAQENVNVLVFVHGWRNDAHIGSQDVERFHTLLSLSANYAQQRNVAGKTPSKTIGIFIGWQGRVIDEKSDANDPDRGSLQSKALDKLAIPTILSRKPRSDAIAKPIGQKILDIETLVKGAAGEKHNNKLIILGHSLGGNILIQGLSDKLVERIAASQSAAHIRGVGDLVLLINPASQARHFFAVQQAAFANRTPPFGSPVVVSLTAAKYFNQVAKTSQKWDTAVGEYLPLALRLLTLNTGQPEDIQSIGNYLPITALRPQDSAHTITSVNQRGVSHEIELDDEAGVATTYAFTGASAPTAHPKCPVDDRPSHMGWQKAAMFAKMNPPQKINFFTLKSIDEITSTAAASATHTAGWDTEFKGEAVKAETEGQTLNIRNQSWLTLPKPSADGPPSATHGGLPPKVPSSAEARVRINIRHGAARHKCLDRINNIPQCRLAASDAGLDIDHDHQVLIPTIGPAWSPVWNAAVHSNVIDEHGGYLSHTLWCVLNRFALDRPAPLAKKGGNAS